MSKESPVLVLHRTLVSWNVMGDRGAIRILQHPPDYAGYAPYYGDTPEDQALASQRMRLASCTWPPALYVYGQWAGQDLPLISQGALAASSAGGTDEGRLPMLVDREMDGASSITAYPWLPDRPVLEVDLAAGRVTMEKGTLSNGDIVARLWWSLEEYAALNLDPQDPWAALYASGQAEQSEIP
jgi:hypothetical protein